MYLTHPSRQDEPFQEQMLVELTYIENFFCRKLFLYFKRMIKISRNFDLITCVVICKKGISSDFTMYKVTRN